MKNNKERQLLILELVVPMPKIWTPDTDFVGKQVTMHMCDFHEDCDPAKGLTREEVSMTGNCNCALKGKTVTITGLKATPRATFYRSTCYTIAESKNLIHEGEFSAEKSVPGEVSGYVLQGKDGNFLNFAEVYHPYIKKPIDGYIFNTGLIKNFMKNGIRNGDGDPVKAWPVKSNQYGGERVFTGEAVTWEELKKIILVK